MQDRLPTARRNLLATHGRTIHMGHSRPMHSVAVPINVRCYSDTDIIVRCTEVTLKASKRESLLDDLVGGCQ